MPKYQVLSERCPKCGGRLIFNTIKECGELRCDWTDATLVLYNPTTANRKK